MQNDNRLQKVNVHSLMEKFRSKKEIYNFLTQDCKAYLPRLDSTNIYFLKQIIQGQKVYLKRTNIKVASFPQIDGLTVQDFLTFASKKQQLRSYLPDEEDLLHLDKKWICDILYSLDSDGIQKMIDLAKKERMEKIEKNQDLLINMRPEFVEALKNSLAFSTEKGRAAYLIKNSSKRKRKLNQIEELKQEEDDLRKDKLGYISKSKKMKQDVQILKEQNEELENYKQLVQHLHSQGVIDKSGNPIIGNNEPNIIVNEEMD